MNNKQSDDFLEIAVKRQMQTGEPDAAAVERVLKRLSGPLPPQKMAWWRLPGVLLDWQFAPAWPRMAALACFAVLGFAIGIAGVDRPFDHGGPLFSVANNSDFGSIVFEPEALTGARP
jgi:hypothetical protein